MIYILSDEALAKTALNDPTHTASTAELSHVTDRLTDTVHIGNNCLHQTYFRYENENINENDSFSFYKN